MKHFGLGSLLGFSLCLATLGCSVDEIPDGLGKTPGGDSATVKWDLYHKPLPEIPFPNDQAMWPDPTSRTGMRVNASVVAPTGIEETARKKFDQLEGFGTYTAGGAQKIAVVAGLVSPIWPTEITSGKVVVLGE